MRAPDERGFTLVELLVAISILGVVMGAVSAAIIVGLKTTDGTITRLSESHDTQISTAYISGDAQSAQGVTQNVAGDSCSGTGATALVRFTWADSVDTTTDVAKTAAYVVVATGAGRELHRRYCEGSSLTSDVVLTHNLHPSTDPAVVCVPVCSGSPSRPDSVKITVTDASSYSYTLTGVRRTTT